jgi:hypothetical protein
MCETQLFEIRIGPLRASVTLTSEAVVTDPICIPLTYRLSVNAFRLEKQSSFSQTQHSTQAQPQHVDRPRQSQVIPFFNSFSLSHIPLPRFNPRKHKSCSTCTRREQQEA